MAIDKDLAHEAIGLFMHTDRLHKRLVEKRIKELSIHRSQHIMLMVLSKCDETISQKELADRLNITPAAATVTLKKLIKGGYVTQKASKKDGRFNEIKITDKGIEIIKRSKEIFAEIDSIMVNSIDEEELKAFSKTLRKMKENIKEVLS